MKLFLRCVVFSCNNANERTFLSLKFPAFTGLLFLSSTILYPNGRHRIKIGKEIYLVVFISNTMMFRSRVRLDNYNVTQDVITHPSSSLPSSSGFYEKKKHHRARVKAKKYLQVYRLFSVILFLNQTLSFLNKSEQKNKKSMHAKIPLIIKTKLLEIGGMIKLNIL